MLIREYPLCFGCGRENPIGLALRFTCEDGVARASFSPRAEHQGYPGMVHGGLVCTLLDEAMAYAVRAIGCEGHTARLEVRFRASVPLHRPLSVEARAGRRKGRMVEVTARLLGAQGQELATATGRYITTP
ncbi:MAG: PaaI family thioesterase [Bacillota bacterium]